MGVVGCRAPVAAAGRGRGDAGQALWVRHHGWGMVLDVRSSDLDAQCQKQ